MFSKQAVWVQEWRSSSQLSVMFIASLNTEWVDNMSNVP